jgi:hypothetical protein
MNKKKLQNLETSPAVIDQQTIWATQEDLMSGLMKETFLTR